MDTDLGGDTVWFTTEAIAAAILNHPGFVTADADSPREDTIAVQTCDHAPHRRRPSGRPGRARPAGPKPVPNRQRQSDLTLKYHQTTGSDGPGVSAEDASVLRSSLLQRSGRGAGEPGSRVAHHQQHVIDVSAHDVEHRLPGLDAEGFPGAR